MCRILMCVCICCLFVGLFVFHWVSPASGKSVTTWRHHGQGYTSLVTATREQLHTKVEAIFHEPIVPSDSS
jgi:hypothetical protein